MDLLHAHLCDQLFAGVDSDERVFIKGDTLYEHSILTVEYTSYDLQREDDTVHLNFGNQVVMIYSQTSQAIKPWLYAHVIAIYHVFVHTATNPEPKHLELLWVRWMERDSAQLKGVNSSKYTHILLIPHSGIPGESFGFVDLSHIIHACHLIPAFNLGQTHDWLGPSMIQNVKGDWQVFYANKYDSINLYFLCSPVPLCKPRFVDRDAFARFSGIGIGCQRLQATRILEVTIWSNAPDPVDPAATRSEFDESLFTGCYWIDDDDELEVN